MRTHFQPLRRKIGVLMLMMACVLMAGWVRSLHRADFLACEPGHVYMGLHSVDTMLTGQLIAGKDLSPWGWPYFWSIDYVPHEEAVLHGDPWQLNTAGIRFKTIAESPYVYKGYLVAVCYPWIVVPLTMLSAWLLLSKPRPPKTKADSLS